MNARPPELTGFSLDTFPTSTSIATRLFGTNNETVLSHYFYRYPNSYYLDICPTSLDQNFSLEMRGSKESDTSFQPVVAFAMMNPRDLIENDHDIDPKPIADFRLFIPNAGLIGQVIVPLHDAEWLRQPSLAFVGKGIGLKDDRAVLVPSYPDEKPFFLDERFSLLNKARIGKATISQRSFSIHDRDFSTSQVTLDLAMAIKYDAYGNRLIYFNTYGVKRPYDWYLYEVSFPYPEGDFPWNHMEQILDKIAKRQQTAPEFAQYLEDVGFSLIFRRANEKELEELQRF